MIIDAVLTQHPIGLAIAARKLARSSCLQSVEEFQPVRPRLTIDLVNLVINE
jgi:hypothetical protein